MYNIVCATLFFCFKSSHVPDREIALFFVQLGKLVEIICIHDVFSLRGKFTLDVAFKILEECNGITFFKIVRDDNLFIWCLYYNNYSLQIKRLILWLQHKTQNWFILRYYLYCARFRLSLRQSESSLSICRIASKFIP